MDEKIKRMITDSVYYLDLFSFHLILVPKNMLFRHILIILLFCSILFSQEFGSRDLSDVGLDTVDKRFKYSTIIKIPDLSFFEQVYSGLDILEQMDFKPLVGKSIALFTNQTAVNRNGDHIIDLLKNFSNIKVVAFFAAEHGIWGIDDNRATLIGRGQTEPVHGAPIIDMFNKYVYPPHWVMDKIDLVVVDFQDTGSRYSTMTATMSKLFESASEWRIPVMVLDRPNPIRGDIINGPIPRTEFQSYESYHLFPIRHGLTIGEISILINEMGWIKDLKRVELSILPMANWNRDMWFSDTKLIWRYPTPSLRSEDILLAYTGMDLFRGTNMNVGFGTEKPYLILGAPWLGTSFLAQKLKDQGLKGVEFKEINYRPTGSIYYKRVPQYDGLSCSGIEIIINDKDEYEPLKTATTLIMLINHLHPREFQWKEDGYIDKLFGSNLLRVTSAQKKPPDHLPAQWVHDVYKFNEFRQPFLIY
tara:strand:+ start:78 stop:1502 length:1425 start_codon:yes stop_codon:yes gene_type:complete